MFIISKHGILNPAVLQGRQPALNFGEKVYSSEK
jgi:hypothetical protein